MSRDEAISTFSIQLTSIFLAAALVAIGSILPAICTIHESFWIDELHSEWVILGPWNELHARAASGNQTVPYFALMKLLSNGIGSNDWTSPELTVRLFSAISWFFAFAIGTTCVLSDVARSNPLRFDKRYLASIAILFIWILLDWVSWFHAIEARPYGFGLLMTSLLIWSTYREGAKINQPIHLGWILAASASVWIHPVSGLIVIASWIGRLLHPILVRDKNISWIKQCGLRGIEAALVIVSWLPLISGGIDLYSRRSQWQSFAGDSSLVHLVQNYPLGPWLCIPLIGFFFLRNGKQLDQKGVTDRIAKRGDAWTCFAIQLFLIVVIPIGFAWCSTLFGWIPLMHRRYLLGSHLALFLLGGMLLLRVRWTRWIVAVGILSASLLVVQQGTWRHWEYGEWMGWQRLEGWDEAIDYMNSHAKEKDRIYLAPMLIETTKHPFAKGVHPGYLEFPIRSAYPLERGCEVSVVSNSSMDWSRALSHEEQTQDESKQGDRWLLVRTNKGRLNQLIKPHEARFSFWKTKVRERLDFGRVQLLRIEG